jgi:prepilin-type N-terminal cleavage/methylation domain-containing protein
MKRKAFTLIEVLISLSMFAMIMTGIYKLYSSTIKQSDIGFWRTNMNMKTSLFFEKFKSDVIQANNFVDLITTSTPSYKYAPLRYLVNKDFTHSDQIDIKNGIFALNYDGLEVRNKLLFLGFISSIVKI